MTKKLLELGQEVVRFSRNEKNQVDFKREYPEVKFVIGDVRDYAAINQALTGIDYCIHAAAMKHIDKCELQPLEAIKTNVIGSKNVILASINNNIKKLVCLSTDKAANAETTYGSTKFLMERMALDIDSKDTKIVVTRYGNVLGSSGSVIPLFKNLAKEGKPLTITNRNITRFFMPMSEAVDLVLYALEKGKSSDLIVYDNKGATVGMIADCISDNQVEIGIRCVEKCGEALLTVHELNHSLKDGNYFVVSKEKGNIEYSEPLTSDNCKKFTMKELKGLVDKI